MDAGLMERPSIPSFKLPDELMLLSEEKLRMYI